jgi:hypothetical protein
MIVRETIIAAVVARLQAIPGLASAQFLPRSQPYEYPNLSIDDLGHRRDSTDATHSTYTLALQVLGIVKGDAAGDIDAAGANAHTRANALYAATVRALFADPPLLGEIPGGVVQLVDEGAFDIDIARLAADAVISFTVDFDIQFINRSHDPNLT